jgi:hypothetical protein
MRGIRITYTADEMAWLETNRAMVISDYHAAFCKQFARADVTAAHLHGLRKRKKWKVGRAHGRLAGRKHKRRMPVSAAELAWLRDNCTLPIADYHQEFCKAFRREDLLAEQLHALRKREGWRTGRTGRFEKGRTPTNKGKPRSYNENSARTQFKKGNRSGVAVDKYLPIGTERVRDGYLVRKIHDGLPMQSRWRAVHLLIWEAAHGPIPEGMALKCKGERGNPAPDNWEAVPRAMLPRLNNRWGRSYDEAAAELRPTIMAVARLEQQISDRRDSRQRRKK